MVEIPLSLSTKNHQAGPDACKQCGMIEVMTTTIIECFLQKITLTLVLAVAS